MTINIDINDIFYICAIVSVCVFGFLILINPLSPLWIFPMFTTIGFFTIAILTDKETIQEFPK